MSCCRRNAAFFGEEGAEPRPKGTFTPPYRRASLRHPTSGVIPPVAAEGVSAMARASIGHNGGPTMDPGGAWRRHCWTRARADLLPVLPVEVVRLRVRRAAELGLDYRAYASFRAASGHDIVALLFSTNALRLLPPVPALSEERRARLAAVSGAVRGVLVHRPLSVEAVLGLAAGAIDRADPAPRPLAAWGEVRRAVLAALTCPADRVLMVGDTSEERGWAEAARLGLYLQAERYFAA